MVTDLKMNKSKEEVVQLRLGTLHPGMRHQNAESRHGRHRSSGLSPTKLAHEQGPYD